jgi:PAS domain S-box-containing protein
MDKKNRILQILDSIKESSPIANELDIGGFDFKCMTVDSEIAFSQVIIEFQPDLVITDYSHSTYDGISAIHAIKEICPEIIFIIFTDSISELDAVECIKAGAANIVNTDQISSINMIVSEALKYQQARIEKRQIEEQLAKEREILSISLASIGEAIISIDLTGKIVLFNQAAHRITGFSIDEAVDQPVQKILKILDEKTNLILDDPLEYLIEIEKKIQEGIPTKRPVLVTKNDEKILIAGKITSILVDQRKLAGYVIIFDDVTQKELATAQSLLSSKMESIGQLAAGIAHEINTPIQYVGDNLNFINRTFETLKAIDQAQNDFFKSFPLKVRSNKEVKKLLDERKSKKIDHIYAEIPRAIEESLEGVERVRKIVMAIREFSHPSQRVNTLSDINKGILTTVTISKNEWKYCSDLETDLDPNLPLVWCRIDELNQVLLNMIVNATHAIQEKQKLSDNKKGKIIISTSQKQDRVIITVIDTGIGIPENIVNRIFDPFFTTKEVGKGTGQGLSLAHNIIVNHHHGSINVNSTLNIGTTFTIELPIGKQKIEENSDQ